MTNDIIYEENPWDDGPELGERVDGLLPPRNMLKHDIQAVWGNTHWLVPKGETTALSDIAARQNIDPQLLMVSVLQDYIAEHTRS